MERDFFTVKSIVPPLNEDFDISVPFLLEATLQGDNIYFFDNHFKITDPVFRAVISKYKHLKPANKTNIFWTDNDDSNSTNQTFFYLETASKKTKINVKKTSVEIIDSSNLAQCNIDVEKGCFEDANCQTTSNSIEFSEINNLDSASQSSWNIIYEIINKAEFRKLLEEIIILNSNVNIRADIHPFRKMSIDFKKYYYAILLEVAIFKGSLTADQVLRLEEIARQFNINSSWIVSEISNKSSIYYKNSNNTDRKQRIAALLKKIIIPNKYILVADILCLDIFRKKIFPSNDEVVDNLDNLFPVSYSEIMQIKNYLITKI